MTEGLTFKYS